MIELMVKPGDTVLMEQPTYDRSIEESVAGAIEVPAGTHVVVTEDFVLRVPESLDFEKVAPLLCAGIIGLRALRRACLPAGGALGIYGFGASAHLTAQIALAEGASVHVLTRSAAARRLAEEIGAFAGVPAG